MIRQPSSAFVARLRDLLATIESAALVSNVETRVRGLREQLQFACIAMPCDEALVAIERVEFGRLHVPVVARAHDWSHPEADFLAPGTPFAQLLAGGVAFAQSLDEEDRSIEPLRPLLRSRPSWASFAPLRLGGVVAGGVACLREGPMSDRDLSLTEHLGSVLSLTIESFRTERVLFELFARALPDVLEPELGTSLASSLEVAIRALRTQPEYVRRLKLASLCGVVAARGPEEATLVQDVLERFERYFRLLDRGSPGMGSNHQGTP